MYQHFIADATTAGHNKRIQHVISDVKTRVTERIDSKGDKLYIITVASLKINS